MVLQIHNGFKLGKKKQSGKYDRNNSDFNLLYSESSSSKHFAVIN